MAYFTRSNLIYNVIQMYDAIEWFAQGPTADRSKDFQVLIACQQRSLVVGEYLETMGMDYSDIVETIEQGCNILYDMAENLDDPDRIQYDRLAFSNVCARVVKAIEDRIVEITSIDVYDFRNLTTTDKEKVLVENEINRLIDDCVITFKTEDEETEIFKPIVVGTY